MCLNKTTMFYIKNSLFLIDRLLVDFIDFTKQISTDKNYFIYKKIVLEFKVFSKSMGFFIKQTLCLILKKPSLKK